jgi:hypothetical protein
MQQTQTEEHMIKLGSKVRDTITGLEGVAVGRAVYLNGCISVNIEGPINKDGQRYTDWFDEARVETIEAGHFKPQPTEATAGGPDHSTPPRDGA